MSIELTTEIVAAYVAHNAVPSADIPDLIRSVYKALAKAGNPFEAVSSASRAAPALPIGKSVTSELIYCLEDGLGFKSMKRHLSASYGMTPDEYRTKWGLPKTYPMVAPAYAERRSKLAKSIGLGRKPGVSK